MLERKRILWCWYCERSWLSIQNTAGKTTPKFFFVLFTRSASPSGIYGTLLLPVILQTTPAKNKTLFACIHVYSRGVVGFAEQRTAFTRVCKVRGVVEILIMKRAENSLSTKLISQKLIRWPKEECLCEIVKNTVEWNFSNLQISIFFFLFQGKCTPQINF